MQPKQRILSIVRRITGQAQILQQLHNYQQHAQRQQQEMLCLGNSLQYFLTRSDMVRTTTTYKRCAQLASLLSPMDVEGAKYSRFGKDFDGGYVMLDNLGKDTVDAAYSFGIGTDVSWDEHIADRGIDVYMYDHTIDRLPKEHAKFHYSKLGITGKEAGRDLRTLAQFVNRNGHAQCERLVMKMDVEGCEWDVFQSAEPEIISQFAQIVVEFHGLLAAVYDTQSCNSMTRVLQKINNTHQSVHVHANGSSIPLWIGGLVMPDVMEVTYLRRGDGVHKFVANGRQFPTDLDQPTYRGGFDVYLGRFDGN